MSRAVEPTKSLLKKMMRFMFPLKCSYGFTLKFAGHGNHFQQQYKEVKLSTLSEVPQPNVGIVLSLFGFFPPIIIV